MKTYVTFGFDHAHCVSGIIFDADCVAVINHDKREDGRPLAFEIFGKYFCFEYPECFFDFKSMHYYSRGIIGVDPYVVGYYQCEIDREKKKIALK